MVIKVILSGGRLALTSTQPGPTHPSPHRDHFTQLHYRLHILLLMYHTYPIYPIESVLNITFYLFNTGSVKILSSATDHIRGTTLHSFM